MNKKTQILIVEDDMIIAANLSLQLTNLGYEVTGIVSRGEEAILHVDKNPPDILLLDINLKGSLNGIETAKHIQRSCDVAIIYLTANSDESTFSQAKVTRPKAFITKPFNKISLQRTIALVEEQIREVKNYQYTESIEGQVLEDRIFVRNHGNMEKLLFDTILYIEADRNYCTVVSSKGNYVLTSTLKKMAEKLPKSIFIRIHRSYMVNISKLDVVSESHVEIDRKVIPLSKSYKNQLLSYLQTI